MKKLNQTQLENLTGGKVTGEEVLGVAFGVAAATCVTGNALGCVVAYGIWNLA